MSVGFVFYSKFVLRICLYIVSNKSPVMVNSHYLIPVTKTYESDFTFLLLNLPYVSVIGVYLCVSPNLIRKNFPEKRIVLR
jgi:hypothetical protein